MGLWTKQQLREFIKENKLVTAQDAQNALKNLFAETIQEMLEAEMDTHLGYQKHEVENKTTTNSRKGKSKKRVTSEYGEQEIIVPRDHQGERDEQDYSTHQGVAKSSVASRLCGHQSQARWSYCEQSSLYVIGIDLGGSKDVLGMWIGENESAKFWLSVLNDLKNRGVQDILITCVDNLTGFTQAITACYPKTEIQKCIIHQIRNSTCYVSYKGRR